MVPDPDTDFVTPRYVTLPLIDHVPPQVICRAMSSGVQQPL
jgi:hypothetical protein